MSVKQLVENIDSINIAEGLDDQVLVDIGNRVYRQFEEDDRSMDDWVEAVEKGIDLAKPEFEGKSFPWEGASNYKDPSLMQASIQFGDRATLELLRPKSLIAADVIGRNPPMEKKQVAERVTYFMNFQINHDMGDWRNDQSRLFYTLPCVGTAFKKTFYNPITDKQESVCVQYPNFVVNQATKSMDDCRSFSHILDLSDEEVAGRVRSGMWLPLKSMTEAQAENPELDPNNSDKGSNEAEEVIHAADNEYGYIEQQTFYDIDDDGVEEPYVITICRQSRQVVRIVARYDRESIRVMHDIGGREVMVTLDEAIEMDRAQAVQNVGGEQFMMDMGIAPEIIEPQLEDYEVIEVEPLHNITKYGFIPSNDGTFLDYGYYHLLGPMVDSINTTTNQIHDRGTLNNVGGGLLSKEFRNEKGMQRLRIGEWKQTAVPADKMATGIYPNPVQEPSQTLYALNESFRERVQQLLAAANDSGAITAQTAPTTALAIIQEGMIPTSALFKRILDSQSHEFQILFRLNKRTLDDDKYQRVLDEPASAQQDFNTEGLDIYPTANADMASKMQRIQTAEIELSQFDRVLQTGGNPVPLVKNFFEAIGSNLIDQLYPEEGALSPAEREQMQKMQQAQETANRLQELQVQILEREQERMDYKTEAEVMDMATKREQDQERIELDQTKQENSVIMQLKELQAKITEMELKYGAELEGNDEPVQMPRFSYNPISGELTQDA